MPLAEYSLPLLDKMFKEYAKGEAPGTQSIGVFEINADRSLTALPFAGCRQARTGWPRDRARAGEV